MNFMSWNAAYSMFPDMTFLEPRSQLKVCTGYEDDNDAERIRAHIQKYQRLGWNLVSPEEAKASPSRSLQLEKTRRVGDRYSWKIALDIDGIQPSSVPDYVLEHCHFGIDHVEDIIGMNGREAIYESVAYDLTSHVLKHKYTFSPGKANFWRDFMATKLHGLLVHELRNLDVEIRPAFLDLPEVDDPWHSGISRFMAGFVKPDTWKFYDEHIPAWCDEWEKQNSERELVEQMAAVVILSPDEPQYITAN